MHYDGSKFWERMEAEGRTWKWLARVTGYGRDYIYMMRVGMKPVTKKFAEKASAAIGAQMDVLFLPIVHSKGCESVVEESVAD